MNRKGFVLLAFVTLLSASVAFACAAPTNDAVKAALSKDLSKYPGITVKVEDCVATLSGAVDRYTDKQSAGRKARSYGALNKVVNSITVGGPSVADDELANKLARSLAYDRSMQGNVFDWFTVSSENGAVTVAGYAHNPVARDSALGLVGATAGVKDVVNKIEVLPLSTFDDQIRLAAVRRIYGGSSFIGSLDPAHTIRIIVDNGRVKLEGSVLSMVDKVRAEAAVLGLLGVFSVENHLEVGRKS